MCNSKDNNIPELVWIEPSDNPWGIRLLDLRPLTQGAMSTSEDPKAAENAVSYFSEDGLCFKDSVPEHAYETKTNFSLPVDGVLVPGVLFIPEQMEHK